jgi:hypothetical protein
MKRIALVSVLLLVLFAPIILSHPMFGVAQAAGGPVYIRSDGAIQGPNIQRNGDVYTFAGDVEGPLYVEKDDIVIDGAGHSLVGGNNHGIVLEQRHGVTVKNAHITLNTGTIVNLQNTTDCALIGNTLIGTPTENPWGWVGMVPIAVNCQDSQNLIIQNNVIRNFFIGLSLEWSSSDLITGNTFSQTV